MTSLPPVLVGAVGLYVVLVTSTLAGVGLGASVGVTTGPVAVGFAVLLLELEHALATIAAMASKLITRLTMQCSSR
jgi:hypothetical protein